MTKTRVFVSFDYDHDSFLKEALIGQSKLPDSPFEIADWSIKEASSDWRDHARRRMRAVDCVAVICGENTHYAAGVAEEVAIAQNEQVPYFLLRGYNGKRCIQPTTAPNEKIYDWTWDNLKALIGGAR